MSKKSTNELLKIDNILIKENKINIEDENFSKLMFLYSAAIKELETKIDILNNEFKVFYNYDLIDHVNTRVKSTESIMKKMANKNYEPTYENLIENINDIAGVRIICTFKDDIFLIKDLLEKIKGVKVLKIKDYVTYPKKSGYSSYHMIVEVPVNLSQKIIYVKVEIQIRTVAMDFWASLEHKMKYKPQQEITKMQSKELVNCAKIISKLDNKMIALNN